MKQKTAPSNKKTYIKILTIKEGKMLYFIHIPKLHVTTCKIRNLKKKLPSLVKINKKIKKDAASVS